MSNLKTVDYDVKVGKPLEITDFKRFDIVDFDASNDGGAEFEHDCKDYDICELIARLNESGLDYRDTLVRWKDKEGSTAFVDQFQVGHKWLWARTKADLVVTPGAARLSVVDICPLAAPLFTTESQALTVKASEFISRKLCDQAGALTQSFLCNLRYLRERPLDMTRLMMRFASLFLSAAQRVNNLVDSVRVATRGTPVVSMCVNRSLYEAFIGTVVNYGNTVLPVCYGSGESMTLLAVGQLALSNELVFDGVLRVDGYWPSLGNVRPHVLVHGITSNFVPDVPERVSAMDVMSAAYTLLHDLGLERKLFDDMVHEMAFLTIRPSGSQCVVPVSCYLSLPSSSCAVLALAPIFNDVLPSDGGYRLDDHIMWERICVASIRTASLVMLSVTRFMTADFSWHRDSSNMVAQILAGKARGMVGKLAKLRFWPYVQHGISKLSTVKLGYLTFGHSCRTTAQLVNLIRVFPKDPCPRLCPVYLPGTCFGSIVSPVVLDRTIYNSVFESDDHGEALALCQRLDGASLFIRRVTVEMGVNKRDSVAPYVESSMGASRSAWHESKFFYTWKNIPELIQHSAGGKMLGLRCSLLPWHDREMFVEESVDRPPPADTSDLVMEDLRPINPVVELGDALSTLASNNLLHLLGTTADADASSVNTRSMMRGGAVAALPFGNLSSAFAKRMATHRNVLQFNKFVGSRPADAPPIVGMSAAELQAEFDEYIRTGISVDFTQSHSHINPTTVSGDTVRNLLQGQAAGEQRRRSEALAVATDVEIAEADSEQKDGEDGSGGPKRKPKKKLPSIVSEDSTSPSESDDPDDDAFPGGVGSGFVHTSGDRPTVVHTQEKERGEASGRSTSGGKQKQATVLSSTTVVDSKKRAAVEPSSSIETAWEQPSGTAKSQTFESAQPIKTSNRFSVLAGLDEPSASSSKPSFTASVRTSFTAPIPAVARAWPPPLNTGLPPLVRFGIFSRLPHDDPGESYSYRSLVEEAANKLGWKQWGATPEEMEKGMTVKRFVEIQNAREVVAVKNGWVLKRLDPSEVKLIDNVPLMPSTSPATKEEKTTIAHDAQGLDASPVSTMAAAKQVPATSSSVFVVDDKNFPTLAAAHSMTPAAAVEAEAHSGQPNDPSGKKDESPQDVEVEEMDQVKSSVDEEFVRFVIRINSNDFIMDSFDWEVIRRICVSCESVLRFKPGELHEPPMLLTILALSGNLQPLYEKFGDGLPKIMELNASSVELAYRDSNIEARNSGVDLSSLVYSVRAHFSANESLNVTAARPPFGWAYKNTHKLKILSKATLIAFGDAIGEASNSTLAAIVDSLSHHGVGDKAFKKLADVLSSNSITLHGELATLGLDQVVQRYEEKSLLAEHAATWLKHELQRVFSQMGRDYSDFYALERDELISDYIAAVLVYLGDCSKELYNKKVTAAGVERGEAYKEEQVLRKNVLTADALGKLQAQELMRTPVVSGVAEPDPYKAAVNAKATKFISEAGDIFSGYPDVSWNGLRLPHLRTCTYKTTVSGEARSVFCISLLTHAGVFRISVHGPGAQKDMAKAIASCIDSAALSAGLSNYTCLYKRDALSDEPPSYLREYKVVRKKRHASAAGSVPTVETVTDLGKPEAPSDVVGSPRSNAAVSDAKTEDNVADASLEARVLVEQLVAAVAGSAADPDNFRLGGRTMDPVFLTGLLPHQRAALVCGGLDVMEHADATCESVMSVFMKRCMKYGGADITWWQETFALQSALACCLVRASQSTGELSKILSNTRVGDLSTLVERVSQWASDEALVDVDDLDSFSFNRKFTFNLFDVVKALDSLLPVDWEQRYRSTLYNRVVSEDVEVARNWVKHSSKLCISRSACLEMLDGNISATENSVAGAYHMLIKLKACIGDCKDLDFERMEKEYGAVQFRTAFCLAFPGAAPVEYMRDAFGSFAMHYDGESSYTGNWREVEREPHIAMGGVTITQKLSWVLRALAHCGWLDKWACHWGLVSEVSIGGALLFLSSLDEDLRTLLESWGWHRAPLTEWATFSKYVATMAARCARVGTLDDADKFLRKMSSCCLRVIGEADWEDEARKRTKVCQRKVGIHLDYDESFCHFSGKLAALACDGMAARTDACSLDEFWLSRSDYTASGSSSLRRLVKEFSEHDERTTSRDRADKRAVMDALPKRWAQAVLDSVPCNFARGTTKMEVGAKLRALLATDDGHTFISAYCLHGAEASGSFGGMAPTQAVENIAEVVSEASKNNGWLCSLDYTDYNAIHTLAELNRLYVDRAHAWAKKHRIGRDKSYCCMWVAEAYARSEYLLKDGCHPVYTGLFSGSRGTSYDNTTKHEIDRRIVLKELKAMGFAESGCMYAVECGDDELSKFNTLNMLLAYTYVTRFLGHPLNPGKQRVGRKHAEYLQRHFDGITMPQQSLGSMLGTLMTGNWYVDSGCWLDSICQSTCSNWLEASHRGLSLKVAQMMAIPFLDTAFNLRLPDGSTGRFDWWSHIRSTEAGYLLFQGTNAGDTPMADLSVKISGSAFNGLGARCLLAMPKRRWILAQLDKEWLRNQYVDAVKNRLNMSLLREHRMEKVAAKAAKVLSSLDVSVERVLNLDVSYRPPMAPLKLVLAAIERCRDSDPVVTMEQRLASAGIGQEELSILGGAQGMLKHAPDRMRMRMPCVTPQTYALTDYFCETALLAYFLRCNVACAGLTTLRNPKPKNASQDWVNIVWAAHGHGVSQACRTYKHLGWKRYDVLCKEALGHVTAYKRRKHGDMVAEASFANHEMSMAYTMVDRGFVKKGITLLGHHSLAALYRAATARGLDVRLFVMPISQQKVEEMVETRGWHGSMMEWVENSWAYERGQLSSLPAFPIDSFSEVLSHCG